MQHLDDLEHRVIAVIAEQTGLKRDRIKPEMLVEHELGCTGEDAWDLMETMQREFGIDMAGIDLNRHFDREGGVGWPLVVILVVALPFSLMSMMPIGWVSRVIGYVAEPGRLFAFTYVCWCTAIVYGTRFLPYARARRAGRIGVTVQDLIDAARTKKWAFPADANSWRLSTGA